MNDSDRIINPFERTHDKSGTALQRQVFRGELSASTPRHLCEEKAQHLPAVEQHKAHPDQQKAIHRVGRGRPPADLLGAPVAAFNREAPPIALTRLLRHPVQTNQNEDHPLHPRLHPPRAFRRLADATDRKLGSVCRRLVLKSVARAITLAPSTQGARSACAPANGAGDDGRLPVRQKPLLHRDPGKTFIQIQEADAQSGLQHARTSAPSPCHRWGGQSAAPASHARPCG